MKITGLCYIAAIASLPFLMGCSKNAVTDPTSSNTVATTASSSSSMSATSSDSLLYAICGYSCPEPSTHTVVTPLPLSSSSSNVVAKVSSSSLSSSFSAGSSSSSYVNMLPCIMCPIEYFGAILWNPTVTAYEVQVPTVVDGSCGSFSTCGGWWMAYGVNGGAWSPKNPDGSLILADSIGEPMPNGNLDAVGLKIHLSVPAASASAPAIAGIYFDFNKSETPQDISGFGGYRITYVSSVPLQLELGWDTTAYGTNTWVATLPVQTTAVTVNLPWSAFVQDTVGFPMHQPITIAEQKALSMRIRLKNTTNVAEQADFELTELHEWNE